MRHFKENLLVQFSVLSFVVMTVIAVVLAVVLSNKIQSDAVDALVTEAVGSASERTLSAITPADLEAPMTGARYDRFHQFVQGSIISERTARVKLWAKDGLVIYSNDPAGAGEKFPPEENLLKALSGENAIEIKMPIDPENARERFMGTLMTVYTPIIFPGTTEPQGALEIYQYYEPTAQRINDLRRWIFGSIGIGFVVLYSGLVSGVRRGWQTINRQQAALAARTHQQVTVAEFGQQALTSDDLATLMDEAVSVVARTLKVEYGLVLEFLPDSDALLLRAGVGWPMELVDQVTIEANPASQVGYTLFSGKPVVVEDLQTETRFSEPPLFQKQGVVSGMSVIIKDQDWSFGVLGVYTTRRRTFTQDDIHFLQAIANVLVTAIERKASEEMWRRYDFIVNASKDFMTLIGENHTYVAVNDAFCHAHGKSRAEIIDRTAAAVWGEEQYLTQIKGCLEQCFARNQVHRQAWFEFGALGRRYIDVVYFPYYSREGTVTHVAVVSRDITEPKQLEDQLRQAQKLEAIGSLAGGIAHDFNNLLTAMMGYAGLGLEALPPDHPVYSDIQGIQKTTQRAAHLTRQLLAFSRQEIIEPKVLNLNDLMLDTDKMLRRLIREDIELMTLPTPDLGLVKVDASQIEQVLVNLAVNACDAMPNGGRLTIKTANVTFDQDYTRRHVEVMPGEYVMLAVSDTGIGMTEEVKAHLFEPFFTTKEVGQGTGLGLATCFGIVKQSGGHIWVYSEPGQGTTFKIYLPQVEVAAPFLTRRDEVDEPPRGTETVLLVEDGPAVRALASRTLRQQGYTVLEAINGDEALRVAQERAGQEFHLLLTDVVMPRMGGKELADRLRTVHPDLKVLFISGHTDTAIVHEGVLEPGVAFLQKPFTPVGLARKVRKVLDIEV